MKVETNFKRGCFAAVATLVIFFISSAVSDAREITDMAGRKVTVPDKITRVYSASPPITYMVYSLDPSLLTGWNFPPNDSERKFIPERFAKFPVLGGWFGQGKTPNIEAVINARPDVAIYWKSGFQNLGNIIETFSKIGVPTVIIDNNTLQDYSAAYELLGDLLDRKDRSRQLAKYIADALDEMNSLKSKIGNAHKPAVFYAEGPDGLSTDCDTSFHTEVIRVAGGDNVYKCQQKEMMGMEKISMEQIMVFNPEIILAFDKGFYASVYQDARWKNVAAVKNKKVYPIPSAPFNWFDRPPSFMRALGVKWAATIFYPEHYTADIAKETRAFYKLFLNVDLSDGDIDNILNNR